jgi:hypothetical protein
MPDTPNPEFLRRLDEVDWPTIVKRMMAYAAHLAKNEYTWRGGTILPKGGDIEDIVFIVVKKLYSGERTWDPSRVSLEAWLALNIRSEMNNLFRSAFDSEGNLRELVLQDPDQDDPMDHGNGHADEAMFAEPETALLEQEQQERRERLVEALYEAISDDKLLVRIFEAIVDGCERKPSVLAERLQVPVTDINNALKRLDRHVSKVAQEQETQDE